MRKDVDGSLRVETFGDSDNSFVRVSNTVLHKSCQTRKLGTLVPRGIVVLGNSLPFNCFYDIDCFTKICHTIF